MVFTKMIHCVPLMTQYPRMQRENWAALATLAQLTSVCCVGAEPGEQSQAFHRLFLPSVMDGFLSLAAQLMRREQCVSLFRKVMDSVCLLLRSHPQLTTQVGGASVRLILLMANQQEARVKPLLLSFRGMGLYFCITLITDESKINLSVNAGLDSLLDKDWRGRGFDQEAAWRSFQTRRRLRSLNRAVSRRRQQRQHEEEQRGEEELRFQVCVRRQQARRKFHQKQRQLLQLLPPDQVQWYLQECERQAAVEGLTDSRRVELQRQVDQQVSLLPVGSAGETQRYTHTHTHTQLEKLRGTHTHTHTHRTQC
ncbi:hypothetical protein F7725_008845 [Dissostichus mawsoni]|uniref:Uncharacterized protein n=1 Tax=Dissostichus mawsoni TaxID=36200 RepID=A0A7J5Z5T0_DISMA|nr:hypothetical protein F7725_008845 [Dissostichus mawsoni]